MSTKTQTKSGLTNTGPVYLDCNATTPIEPAVRDVVLQYLEEEYGNAGSRTHEFGARAKSAVQRARESVAQVAAAESDEVLFTSGATESNNLALLGLQRHGEGVGRKHIVSTSIEHKAVLEPLGRLRELGFEVTLVDPTADGAVTTDSIMSAVRPDTLCVSVMHVNNETGVVQPVQEIAAALGKHEAFLHVDAAQGFGKLIPDLQTPRIDFISVSAHKIYGPKGVGALIARRRGYNRPPLAPLMVGGGQERGLRPGTHPVGLIAGLGVAADLARKQHAKRAQRCLEIRRKALVALEAIGGIPTGNTVVPSTLHICFPGLDSEALMVVLKDLVAISNGSACTSQSYSDSHVLTAMKMDAARIRGALRMSWSHLTTPPDWRAVSARIQSLR